MKPPQLRLLLARHGESEANRRDVFLGRTDSPLTAEGKAQVEALARAMADEPLAAVYTSPLRRAYQTAKAVAAWNNCPLHVDARLLEQDFGWWEGLTLAEAAYQYPSDFAAWQADAARVGPTGGESLIQVANRLLGLYDDLRKIHFRESVLLVGHGGAFNALLCTLLNTPLRWLWVYRLPSAAVCKLLVHEEGVVLTRLSGY